MTAPLRLVFAGTPDFARTSLDALLASRHEVMAVYTQPDRPAGRGQKLAMSPVKTAALGAGIPVLQPLTLKTVDAQAALTALQPDLLIVVAYGLLLPQAVLDIPRLGCINVHGSLLPRWRGAAPIQRAIAAGDSETGVTIMQMDAGLDTGAMLHRLHTAISRDDTGGSVHDRLATLGAEALMTVLNDHAHYHAARARQHHAQATYAHKLKKEDGDINWTCSAHALVDLIRAFNPWPVAQTTWRGETLRIWRANENTPAPAAVVTSTSSVVGTPGAIIRADRNGLQIACGTSGESSINITHLQLPGKKVMAIGDLLNGHPDAFPVGDLLGVI